MVCEGGINVFDDFGGLVARGVTVNQQQTRLPVRTLRLRIRLHRSWNDQSTNDLSQMIEETCS